MFKFLVKILLFLTIVVFIDFASGYCFEYLKKHAHGGDTSKNYYISEISCDDVLILGSSRAARHYDPKILEDSLNLSCYNCGEPGCGILTAYARYELIAKRHKPKLIIYEVSPEYDYLKTDDYSKYLGPIRQYADKTPVKDLFLKFGDEFEAIRLLSKMYKNNSHIVNNIKDNLIKGRDYKGYKPLNGVLDANTHPPLDYSPQCEVDSIKLFYVKKLIGEVKKDKVPICFVVSPKYSNSDTTKSERNVYSPIYSLCRQYHIPFYNHIDMDGISGNRLFFQDYGHMNQSGATNYTKAICSELMILLKSSCNS